MNYLFSLIGWVIIRIIHPIALLLLIPLKYKFYKTIAFAVYFISLFIFVLYKSFYNPINFTTTIGNHGHLKWRWAHVNKNNLEVIIAILYILCYIPSFFMYPKVTSAVFMILFYTYFVNNTELGSMWCFLSNSILIYILFKILFILPFREYSKLC